ncbi:hypothetical protein [Acidicapsa acidisoli]|uniref:hypothetical protein n=1 Tax=Acidicapsa acidisoli TaxID=1615681 RepID=UPI0021E0948D|nr:hypothetical protein [Acidicapsa acidisoli]
MVRHSFLLSLFAVTAVSVYAQTPAPTACPWVTKGTAEKALGGEVSLSVNLSDKDQGSCNFSRSLEPAAFLRIEVSRSALASCPADSSQLKGIGNEALRCKLPGQMAETISSRVRDMHFTVTLNLRAKSDSEKSSDAQDDALEHIAETVAGNLF